ncbi:MAG: SIS domain-containing protein [Clostridia bacterium]|nr:SIS domain-containing protein [Clostridia bacterium]
MSAIDTYYGKLSEIIRHVFESQTEQMEAAAQRIAACFMQGHMLYTFGTGHAHLLSEELFYRAGGPAQVCPILDERLMLHLSASASSQWERKSGYALEVLGRYGVQAGDVMIIISNSGRNAVPVEMALEAKQRGVYTIALTSLQHSGSVTPRNPAGRRLFEVADLVLDNGGVTGDAVVQAGDGRTVAPTSTAVGSAMLQAISARAEEIGREKGQKLQYFMSSNVDGGDEYNEQLIELYRARVPGL